MNIRCPETVLGQKPRLKPAPTITIPDGYLSPYIRSLKSRRKQLIADQYQRMVTYCKAGYIDGLPELYECAFAIAVYRIIQILAVVKPRTRERAAQDCFVAIIEKLTELCETYQGDRLVSRLIGTLDRVLRDTTQA